MSRARLVPALLGIAWAGIVSTAPAQVTADAGPDQTILISQSAQLAGSIGNRTVLDWWTADGNGGSEDEIVQYHGVNGVTTVGPLMDAQSQVFGSPGDLVLAAGQVYGVDTVLNYLYTVDPQTGLVTTIGSASAQWLDVHALAYDANGDRLFGIDEVQQQLLLFDRSTGAITTVGSQTLSGWLQVRSLAYDDVADKLYAADQASDSLLEIDPSTGQATVLRSLPAIADTEIEELDFFQGSLYAVQASPVSGPVTQAQLRYVPLPSGTVTDVGPALTGVSPTCLIVRGVPERFVWSQVSGPGTATFSSAEVLDPTVGFSATGVYTLELEVFAWPTPVTDTVAITVDPCPNVDTDGDGTIDCYDGCPNDPSKIAPGVCGCGVPDTDSDGDGTPNCNDGCPNDPSKIAPGDCGCGVPDTDSDGDGTPNCHDGCPNDPSKIAPGDCGCGVPETDTDGDGTPNCIDGCPNDPNKTAPGQCGCGAPETDTDGDGTPDCVDGCPNDPSKIVAGQCGCGVPETDSDNDGTPNCVDDCPNDPNKTSPGQCGCGNPDTDSDNDGVANCIDGCPEDPNKIAPGQCGCGVPDTDGDGDGVSNCIDNCPGTSNASQADGDGDRVGDPCDNCPSVFNPNQTPCGAIASFAGWDDSILLSETAQLSGVVINRSKLEWWTADGNATSENKIVKYHEDTGLTIVGPIRTNGGQVFGYPADLAFIGSTCYGTDAFLDYLYTVNTGSGICATVGSQQTVYNEVHGMAYDSAGDRLFGVDQPRQQLVRITYTTGTITPVGTTGLSGYTNVRSLAYDPATDKLYALDRTTNKLLVVNPTTGIASQLVTLPSDPNLFIDELDFFHGELYAMEADKSAGFTNAGRLQHIALPSGAVSYVGPPITEVSPHSLIVRGIPEDFEWSKVSGPGVVNFSDTRDLTPSVTFSAVGTYVLELEVFAWPTHVSDTVTIDVDPCPNADSDGDGTLDCFDGCPSDPGKIAPGACGCGVPDSDADVDGILACNDNCPSVFNPSQADCDDDGMGDACEIAQGLAQDCNANGIPDDCEADCNGNGIPDDCDIAAGQPDVNGNLMLDSCEIGTAFCLGDGSQGSCPGVGSTPGCANGFAGRGCAWSSGPWGGNAYVLGDPGANNIVVVGNGLPASTTVIVVRTVQPNSGTGQPFGDGLLCLTGTVTRLAAQTAVNGTTHHPINHGAGPGVFNYQLWFRNQANFCTSARYNTTNGVRVTFP